MTAGFNYNFNVPGIEKVGKETNGKFDIPVNVQSYKEGTVFYNLFGEDFKVIYKGETHPVEISLDPQ